MSLKIAAICPICGGRIEGYLGLWDGSIEPPEEGKAILLKLNSCQSGGLYGCYIECPVCSQEIDLMD